MTTTPTFEESKHHRAADGKFANNPWSPQHSMSGKARVRIGAAGVAVSAFGVLEGALNLVGAILAVGAASLIAWGGYKGAKRRKRRRAGVAPRPKAGTKVTRFGTVRLTTAEDIEAYAKLLETKRATRKKGSHFARWPSATVTPDPSLSPEDKFKTLRNSGYKGWVDQDGNAVADVDEWITQQKAAAE